MVSSPLGPVTCLPSPRARETQPLLVPTSCVHLSVVLAAAALGLTLSGRAGTEPPVLLVLGDSLSAAYGIATESGWVSLLQHRLDECGLSYQVINASSSGETTAGGLSRLSALLGPTAPRSW